MSRLASTKSPVRSLVTSEPGLDPHSRDDHDDGPGGNISPQERIKRVATRTMDLGRSFTSLPRSPTLTLHPASIRPLSQKRKDRGKETQASQDQGQGDCSQAKKFPRHRLAQLYQGHNHFTMPPQSDGTQTMHHAPQHDPTAPAVPNDDSPFITPPSPTLAPTRPLLESFRHFGSVRVAYPSYPRCLLDNALAECRCAQGLRPSFRLFKLFLGWKIRMMWTNQYLELITKWNLIATRNQPVNKFLIYTFRLDISECGSQRRTWPLRSTLYIVLLPGRDGRKPPTLPCQGKYLPRRMTWRRHPMQNRMRI